MRKTTLMMCCSAALALGVAGCNPQRTDDTLTDQDRPAVIDPATGPIDAAPPIDTTGTTTGAAAMLTVATGSPGPHLVDNQGRAVYALEGDTDGSKCTDACLEAWPPVQAEGQTGAAATTGTTGAAGAAATTGTAATATGVTGAPGELRANLVGTTQRADGTAQVTYNGHPLYRYAKDTGSGSTAGHGVDDQWGEWYLVSPAGDVMDDDDA